MALSAASSRTPHSVSAHAPDPVNEEIKLFRRIKLRVQSQFKALIIRALEVSEILDCYESFDLSLQVRDRKILSLQLSERLPTPKNDDA